MPSLEQIAKGAKASGLTQKDFEARILANPRYSNLSREEVAVAWSGGLKKKDQSSGIKSPGEKTESMASPSLSVQERAPIRATSVSDAAPSLSRQQGLSDLSKQKPASTKPRGEYDGLARPGRTPVAPADVIATATKKQMTNENELGQVRAFAGRELLNEIANVTSKVTDDQAGNALIRDAKKVDDLYKQFSPDDSGSMFVRDQNGNTAIDPNALNNVFKFADAEVAKGVALKLREEELGNAIGNNATSRLGLSVLEMAFTLPDLIGNLALSTPYYLSRAMTPGFTGEFNPVTTAFGDFADRNRIQTELGEIGKGFGEVRNELSRAEMVTDFGEERANLGIVGNFSEGTVEGFGAGMAMLGNSFVENLPQLAITVIAPEIGLPMLATMSATQTYNEVLDNKNYSTADKVAYATVMGGVEFLSEKILNADIRALRGAISDAGIDLTTKQGKKELADLMFGKVPKSLRVAVEEPLEEAIVSATGEVMQAAIEGKPINVANIAEGALAGLGAGAGISVLTNGISAIGKTPYVANIIKTQSQIKKLSDLMNDPSISEEEKAVLRPKLEQLIKDDKKIRENSADYYSKFTDEDVQETVKLNQIISEGIKNYSKMTTPEAKAEVAANVKAAMEAKKAIETKYDSQEGVDEIMSLPDDQVISFNVESLDQIPEQFRDRAEKKNDFEFKVRETIFGLPIGKETTKVVNQGYSYTLTGKEAKDYAAQNKTVDTKYDSQEGQQVPGTQQTGEAPIQAQPVEGAGTEAAPAGRVVQGPKQEVGTVRSLINRRATYSDPVSGTIVEGDVYQDGQRVVLETAEGKIFDIGNVEEMQDKSPREFGLMEAQERISVNEDGSFVYNGGDNQKIPGGTVMVNRRGGLKSIKRGKDGSIKSVTLTSPDGTQTYNLTGQDAVDAAYQIVLNFSTSPAQAARVEQLLNENEQARTEIQQAARTAREVVTVEPITVATTQEATTDTVGPSVGGDGTGVTDNKSKAPVGKVASSEEVASRVASSPSKSRMYTAVKRAVNSLKKLFPDAEYVFVDSDAEAAEYYKQNMDKVPADEKGTDKGRIIQNKNNGRIELVINTSRADATTVYHELFHAAFYKAYAQDAATAIDFANRLSKVLNSGTAAEKAIAKRVDEHVAKYDGDTEGVVSEEFLSELAGILAADSKSITQGMAAKIANFINNISKKMGIGPVFTEAATTKEVVDFMNSFAAAAREGRSVTEKKAKTGALKTASSKESDRVILYHAGPVKISSFDPDKIRGGSRGQLGYGFYFGSFDKASGYGTEITTVDVSNLNLLGENSKLPSDFLDKAKKWANSLEPGSYKEEAIKYVNKAEELLVNDPRITFEDFRKVLINSTPSDTDKLFSEMMVGAGVDGMAALQYDGVNDFIRQAVIYPQEKVDGIIIKDDGDGIFTGTFRPSSSKSVKNIDIKETRNGFTRPDKFPAKTKSPFEFANETFITTQSDRLASGEQVLPNGEKITLRGGFGYPAMTNYVWAASELGKAKALAGQINRQIKEKGYALLAPLVMSESSHKGNYTYFTAAMSLINSAADKKKLSNKKFLEVVKSAAETAGVDVSSVNAKTVKENVDILMDLFSVEGGTFQKRSSFITGLLGTTTKKGGVHKPKLPGVITSDQLAEITADPFLKGLEGSGYTMSVIRITKPVKTRNTSASEDGFTFHESYPAIIESTDDKDPGIELFVFDDAFKVEEVFPSIETSTGKIVTLESVGGDVNKYQLYLGLRNIPAITKAKFIVSATTQDDGRMPADEAVARLDNLSSRSSKLNYDKKGFDSNELLYLSTSKRKKSEIEKIINSGTYAFLTAENPNNTKATAEENEDYMKDAKVWLSSRGYNYTSIYGMYDNKENSFFVPYMTFEDADAFRKEFNQESVAHSDGLIYADSYNPRVRGKNSFDVDYKSEDNNYYSVFRDSNNEIFGVSTTYDYKKSPSLEKGLKKAKTKKEAIIEILEESGKYALNDDGKGNFAFFHYGTIEGPAIKGSFFGKNKYTSDKRYYKPVSMYYTRRGESEPMVQTFGRKPHVVLVPKDKVYPFNSDPMGFYDEAHKRYVLSLYPTGKAYGLTVEKDLHKFSFPADAQAAFIGEIAKENGYLMMVAAWGSMGLPTRGESQVDLEYDVEATKTYRETNERRIYPDSELIDIPVTDFAYRSSKTSEASDVAREVVDQYYKNRGNVDQNWMQKLAGNVYSNMVRTPEQMEALRIKETRDSKTSRQALKIRRMAENLYDLIKNSGADAAALVTEYMSGPTAENIDAIENLKNGTKILDAATEMRAFLDQMSRQLVDGPAFAALNQELKEVILGNVGSYLKTSYRFWKDKNYKITDKAIKNAAAHVYDVIRAKKMGLLVKEGKSQQEIEEFFEATKEQMFREAVQQINDYVREVEKIRSAPKFKGSGMVTTGQVKIPGESFQKRKDIPAYIQELLGVEKDPQIRFIDTALALTNILYKGEMAAKMANAFGNDFFISDDVITKEDRESGLYKMVKDEYSPLNRMWVPTDIFKVINNEDLYDADTIFGQRYYDLLKLSRKTKVTWNIPTWRKNITGGWQIIMANGILNPQFIKDLANRPAFTLKGKETEEMTQLLDEMAQYGLIGGDVNANVINGVDAMYSGIIRGDYSYVDKTWNLIKNVDKKLSERYSAIDDYTKMVIYRNKRDSFAKKLYGANYDTLNQTQQEQVRAAAAEETKQTTPTFSRLPPFYRALAKVPLGDFLSFKLEAVRSLSMIINTASSDLKKAMDPKLSAVQRAEYAKTGLAKFMGAAGAISMSYVIPSMIESALGFDDEDEIEDMKSLRPNWMSGDNLIVKRADSNGNVSVYNMTMEDTYGEISSMMINSTKGEFGEVAKVFSDAVKVNMVVNMLTNLANKKDQYGRPLFESYDSGMTQSWKVAMYLMKETVIPPFLYSSVRDAGYRAEQTGENILMLSGENVLKRSLIRDYQYNIGQQFYFDAVGVAEGITKDEQYTNLTGAAYEDRLADIEKLRQKYEAIVRYGNRYDNYEMIKSAKSAIKKYYGKDEERYILYGQMK